MAFISLIHFNFSGIFSGFVPPKVLGKCKGRKAFATFQMTGYVNNYVMKPLLVKCFSLSLGSMSTGYIHVLSTVEPLPPPLNSLSNHLLRVRVLFL